MWAFLQSSRELRDLATFDATWAVLMLVATNPQSVPTNGPTALLAARCERIGWQLLPNGLVQDQLSTFCVLTIHWGDLVSRVLNAWPHILAVEVAHRASFRGIQDADLFAIGPALAQYGNADQVYLRCCMDGTLYTDTHKQADNRGADSKCVYCGQPDSFYHRIWQCPFFAECRAGFPFFDVLPTLPPCLTCHGWPLKSVAFGALQQWYCRMSPPFRSIVVPQCMTDHVVHLFTDGACACPSTPQFRFASWAVTMACGHSTLSHVLVDSGHVFGLSQTAYRGELTAMHAAIHFAAQQSCEVCIWCDNLAVFRKVNKILAGKRTRRNRPHSDIWMQIEHLIVEGELGTRLKLMKVVSHCEDLQASPIEQWAFWHNRLADEAAASVNFRRPQEFWDKWIRAVQSVQFLQQVHSHIFKVLLRVARKGTLEEGTRAFTAAPPQGTVEPVEGNDEEVRNDLTPPSDWRFTTALAKKYRRSNVVALHEWWTTIGVEAVSGL